MKTVKLLVLAAALAVSPACKGKDKDKKATPGSGSAKVQGSGSAGAGSSMAGSAVAGSGSDMAGSGSAMAGSAPMPPPVEDTADWIKVHAAHSPAKPVDPVELKFEKFKIVKSKFDPAKIEGGTATIELDITSLKSNSDERDKHLATPDYIDVKKNATATIDIGNVKKKDDKNFTADAKVKFRGIEQKYPVAFEVVEAKDDWIRVKGEHTFKRLDFKVGKEVGKAKEGVAAELTVKLQLTLKKG